jgi:hypothetical protein
MLAIELSTAYATAPTAAADSSTAETLANVALSRCRLMNRVT